ncbi:hypothetical protein [Cupriavidus taiwanensis]|uniref:Uncharacterized protein n=1 Tax=Cupriavidus taiwanensis TaxID=164546 RepID=A0A975X3H4_9BURK|nr:hypothetical protein CBM2587_A70063 [Cupriavidus taiwanensis]
MTSPDSNANASCTKAAAQFLARLEACASHGACMPYGELFRQVVALGGLHRQEAQSFLQHVQDSLHFALTGPANRGLTSIEASAITTTLRKYLDHWEDAPDPYSLGDVLRDTVTELLSHAPPGDTLPTAGVWRRATQAVLVEQVGGMVIGGHPMDTPSHPAEQPLRHVHKFA